MPEIVNCPECQRQLRVPDNMLGKSVKCPTCGATFTAAAAAPPEPAAPPPSEAVKKAGDEEPWSTKPARTRADEDDEEEAPRRRKPVRRRVRDDDDEDDYDDRPSRRDLPPHRGVLILVFGILSFVIPCVGIIFGIIAWVMGTNDLAEMSAGRMDPEGRGMTQAGRICGMVGTILFGIFCLCGVLQGFLGGLGGPGPGPGRF